LVTLSMIARPARATEEAPPEAAVASAPQGTNFSREQLEQLVAPIALYPDPLATQVLMAATYPLEVVEAARWRAKNASLQGDDLDKALESRNWDPSVESLTHFLDLLQRMSDNLDWTNDLGDAFLGQQSDVLDAVQRMRGKAYEAGTLKTTKEQVVTREVVNEKEIVRVEPADPQVIYAPTYSSTNVYGSAGAPAAPYYPAMMAYPPGYVATASLLSFGAGMAVGAAAWGDCDWGSNNVYNNYGGGGGGGNQNVNINKNKERNVDRSRNRTEGGRQKWQHHPEHRGGVRYRDQASARRYGGSDQVASRDRANRDAARGFDRGQAGGMRPSQRPAGGRQETASRQFGGQRPGGSGSQQPATRPGGGGQRPATSDRGGAFGGYESGRSAREASARGASSRGGSSYAGGGRGGGFGGGGGGGRGGGGSGGGRGGGGRGGGGRGGRR